jgi:hypothetical protein
MYTLRIPVESHATGPKPHYWEGAATKHVIECTGASGWHGCASGIPCLEVIGSTASLMAVGEKAMLEHEHFSYTLLYCLSPEHLAQMHVQEIINVPSEPRESRERKLSGGYLLAILRKRFRIFS